MKIYLLFFIVFFCRSISAQQTFLDSTLINFVNPLIGTNKMGHTFPGVSSPFGMVQLSPETNSETMFVNKKYNPEVYKYCSGYQYEDSILFGFSHTHFSGTGHSDLGDFLIMPVNGPIQREKLRTKNPKETYQSKFIHSNEIAKVGYYKVDLMDQHIKAELTCSDRVGFHQYTFHQSNESNIVLDLMYNIYNREDKNVWTFIRVENDSTVTGYRITNGWGRTRTVYFAMEFSKAFFKYGQEKLDSSLYNGFYKRFKESDNFPEMAGKNIRTFFSFKTDENEKIKIKFALSSVSTEGAMLNLNAEIPHWNFEKIVNENQQKWNKELSKIEIESLNQDDKISFYTSMYHTFLSPIVYEDVDGKYRGLDQNINTAKGFHNYTIFSLWDTYRALHPLFNLIQPSRNNDMIHSMLAHYEQSVHKMLPVWSHYANENWCMIGYHSVSVIADAVVKGTTNIDLKKTLDACVNTSKVGYFDGLDSYMKNGFVAENLSKNSVSKTLEFAYDDWCIAQVAKKSGDEKIFQEYLKRSKNYLNVYDSTIGYMRPRLSDGNWRKAFDPYDTEGQGFIEGNALNYGLYVPQDLNKMVEMMGGKEKFSKHLDMIFESELDNKYIEKNEDITREGIIGAYVHGNEPGHHIPYLYNWTNTPWKTQSTVRMIMDKMYKNKSDGLCGNDDAGQMSAWYIFSALGFYPVTPGSEDYALGSPLVKSAKIHFENGKILNIVVDKQSTTNVYVQNVYLNAQLLDKNYISHFELIKGGELKFVMGKKPKFK